MNKRISFEITEEEYQTICKFWEQAKKSPLGAPTALNFDDFCKEIILNVVKGPNLSDLLKDVNLEDLMGSLGDMSQLKDIFSSMKKPETKKEEKKDQTPDDQKYKS